jgi:hypothetical protein
MEKVKGKMKKPERLRVKGEKQPKDYICGIPFL